MLPSTKVPEDTVRTLALPLPISRLPAKLTLPVPFTVTGTEIGSSTVVNVVLLPDCGARVVTKLPDKMVMFGVLVTLP